MKEETTATIRVKLPALCLATTLFIILLSFPIFTNEVAQRALALLIFVAVLWITEAIPLPLTGLLIPVLAVVLHLADPADAFKQFAHPIIFLFMGGFVLAGALSLHSLDKLMAWKLISLARGNFYLSAIFLMLATALMACWGYQYCCRRHDDSNGNRHVGIGKKEGSDSRVKISNARHRLFSQYWRYHYDGCLTAQCDGRGDHGAVIFKMDDVFPAAISDCVSANGASIDVLF